MRATAADVPAGVNAAEKFSISSSSATADTSPRPRGDSSQPEGTSPRSMGDSPAMEGTSLRPTETSASSGVDAGGGDLNRISSPFS